MTAHLRGAWSQRIATSWRGLSNGKAFWNDYDAVIIPNRGPRPQFEVYTYGDQMATRPSLAQAKQAVEEIYGPVGWKLVQLPKEKAVHYYFGPTTEFTDPTSIYVVEHLPRLGVRASLASDLFDHVQGRSCYEHAARHAVEHGGTLVHGTVRNPARPEPEMDHAWVRHDDGSVYEPSTNTRRSSEEWSTLHPVEYSTYSPGGVAEKLRTSQSFGPWRTYPHRIEAAAEGEVYYHGTVARPDIGGGKITPINQRGWGKPTFPADTDPDYAYATKDRDTAWSYAEKAWHSTSHGHPRVFRVRPLGPVESDPQRTANGDLRGNYAGDVRSKHGFEILGEVPMPEHMGKPEDWQ